MQFAWTLGMLSQMRCLKACSLVLHVAQCQQALLDWSTKISKTEF